MNFASKKITSHPRNRWMRLAQRGFSLLEFLLAVAIAIAFLSSVYVFYIKTIKEYDAITARAEAMKNGRAVINSISDELKGLSQLGNDFLLIGVNNGLAFGDGIDNDGDGIVDEEEVDGDDEDTTGLAESHAQLISLRERPTKVGVVDLGDANVDEDVRFGRDFLIFRSFPTDPSSEIRFKTVTYAVDEYDGEDNVLLRQTRIELNTGEERLGLAPIAFNVLGFDVLYWDPNAEPEEQDWVETWDSSNFLNFDAPKLPLPASIYVRVTLEADARREELLIDGAPVDTVITQTILNIEQIINDPLFPRPIL